MQGSSARDEMALGRELYRQALAEAARRAAAVPSANSREVQLSSEPMSPFYPSVDYRPQRQLEFQRQTQFRGLCGQGNAPPGWGTSSPTRDSQGPPANNIPPNNQPPGGGPPSRTPSNFASPEVSPSRAVVPAPSEHDATGCLVLPDSANSVPRVLAALCEEKGWYLAELLGEPIWFNKPPPNSTDNALVLRGRLHSYEKLVVRILRKAQQAVQWRSGTGLIDTCNAQRLILLFTEDTNPATALSGTVKSRNTLIYLRVRAPIREILADGRLAQLLLGNDVQDAANQILFVLLEACRGVKSLSLIADRCRTYVADGLADTGIEKVLDLIDAEFLQATDRETRAAFEHSVWEVGLSPKEVLLRLARLGCELGYTDASVFTRWKEAIKAARDEEGVSMRPGEQDYVNRTVRRFLAARYRFQSLRQLEADLDDDPDMKGPLKAREGHSGQGLSREGQGDQGIRHIDRKARVHAVTFEEGSGVDPRFAELERKIETMALEKKLGEAMALRADTAPAGRLVIPDGPLQVEAIIASGEITKLKGITLQPVFNAHRKDGRYGKDCELCKALGRSYEDECDYATFVKNFGKPGRDVPQLKTHAIFHYKPFCRELRREVGIAVKNKPGLAWMLEKDGDFDGKRRARLASAEAGGSQGQ